MTAAGLTVPPTWIGNDPDAHGAFCEQVGAAVAKTLGPVTYIDAEDARHVLYTARVPPQRYGDPRVAATANLLQAEIADKRFEYRVAVVGSRLFVTEIHVEARAGYLDIRAVPDENTTYRPGLLPANTAAAIMAVTRCFGLIFAAWDLLACSDGRVHALELNPNGMWAFTPDRDQISAAIADELEEATR